MLEDELHRLIGEIYEAAVEPELIPAILRGMCALTKSSAASLSFYSDAGLEHDEFFGIDPAWQVVRRAFEHQNLYFRRRHLARVGTAIVGAQLASDDEIRRLEFYQELLRPSGTVHLLGLAFLSEPGSFGEISLWRPEDRERHGTEELKIANVLARHLQRAFGIAHRVHATSTRAAQLEAMFERVAVGCLLIDASGRLILANAAAEALLRRNEPLRLAGGRVWADTAANRSKWERLLSGLGARPGPCQGTAVTLETVDGASLRLLAVPLAPSRSEALGLAPPSLHLGLVTICDATPLPSDAAATLQRLFGLTAAEANLAIAVFGGESLQEYADRHERSLNTIKTHLRGIFAKTATNRQAELVRKLASLAMLAR